MGAKKALLVVDMQKDFMPAGSLPVPDADKIIPLIQQALNSPEYDFKIASKDAHPKDHISFQEWSAHCVKGSAGAELAEGLEGDKFDLIVQKGTLKEADSYSAFYNAPAQPSNLLCYLQENQITLLYICGVALEYCIKATAADALQHGFKVFLLKDLIKPINQEKAEHIYFDLKEKGAEIR